MKIYLIRHARTVWNDEKRIQGWADIEPYEKAKEVFLDKVKNIPDKPDVIFSSDLKRAIISANLIKTLYPDVLILIDWRLRERNMGKLEGKFYNEIKEKFPELWGTVDVAPPGGESIIDMAERLEKSARDIIWFSEVMGYNVVFIISHQLAIEVLRRIFLKEPINTSLWENLIGSGDWIELDIPLSLPSKP